ncbi:MAG: RNA polymerase sigma factor [Acidobacteriota bacterium]|nr:RNA polymerase sigma factor [Acidobacteriota bacterium]
MDIADEECVRRCKDGQAEEYRRLVERYQKSVFSFLMLKLGNRSTAEEAAQETFVRAFMSLKKLRKPESFHAWILGIADRVAREQYRVQKLRRSECSVEDNIPASPSDPQGADALDAAVAALPENYRRLIFMRYYEGLSCREVGLRLEIPLGTVTKMLSRTYALLCKKLQSRKNF